MTGADYLRLADWRVHESGHWQQVIGRTTGRPVAKLVARDPSQATLDLAGTVTP